jgi:tetratricopeptide (TPR) repeat protein
LKSFLKYSFFFALLCVGFRLVYADIGLSRAAENAIAASSLEQALYRLMALPAGSILTRRAPVESRTELDSLIKQATTNAELFSVRAQEEERQLDFKAAEQDWKQAAELSKNKRTALLSLADFYARRLQPQQEVQVLLRTASKDTIRRALQVASDSQLAPQTRTVIYEAWIKRYPKDAEPLREYFRALLEAKRIPEARNVAARIRSTFPKELSLGLETDAQLARAENGDRAALDVYSKQFSPLWPGELRTSYFTLLSDSHQLRVFLADARSQAVANPSAIEPALRAFFYYEQQGKRDLANQQLLELESRRNASKTAWTAGELKTVGSLFTRVANYDEAAHAYYALYILSGVSDADKSLALASLVDLLLDVPEQSLQFGARDLSIYRNVATLDQHPGFLNGILSLVLNSTTPDQQYQTASQASIAYFHRAMAEKLIERMKVEFPRSTLTAPLESKLFSAYSVYGQSAAILRLTPPWLAAHKNSPEYTKVALLLAETYAATGKVNQELALYDVLLLKLGDASGHHPLGEISEGAKPPSARSPEYAQVLDLYISRLTQQHKLTDAIGIYRREIDRNPDDPGIYERLALFVEQNHLDNELEQTYRAAMKRFEGTAWPDKLARFYIRRKESDAYVALAKELTDKFDGSDLARFISAARPGGAFSVLVYRQVNLYAHQRFPHNLTFVRNLLASYQAKGNVDMAAYERLLRENWFYDATLRNEFFEFLSRTNKLEAELAALPKPEDSAQQKNTAALQQYAEGKAWLADFEGAAPAFVALAGLAPGDDLLETRAISVERSLAPSVSGAFDRATRLAEQRAKAKPADALAATLAGEIYADRELFAKAAPWWNKVATMRPGVEGGYLESATVFWDYYQFPDALRVLQNGRTALGSPALYTYEAGAIHENQNDFNAAIAEYLKSALAHKPAVAKPAESGEEVGNDLAQNRLLVLAKRKQTAAEIEQRTAELAEAKPFNPIAFHLRMALLENQQRRNDIHALLKNTLDALADVDQVSVVQTDCDRLGFEDLRVLSRQRAVELNTDPVEKLSARLQLAKIYQSQQDLPRAESEYAALLTENPNLLGIVRANADFYWETKQPKKAVATLEAAGARSQAPYQVQFRREAAQKAADSADYVTARRLLDMLLSADPYNGDLLAAKAATYASEGDNKGLIQFYSAQLAQLKSANHSDDALRRGYINALVKGKRYDEALEQYEALLNAYPEDENLTRELARFAEANHLADRLTKYYEKATADSPRNYRWPMVLARIDTSLRRYPEAVTALNKAVVVRPDRTDLFIAKADLETRLLRFEDALKTYQKLYDASFHDSLYLASQASLHARLGHNADVVRLLKAAYVDAHPRELNGYVEAMGRLADWHMYTEVDQIYQEAKPNIRPNNGDFQRLAVLEGQALAALRKPVEALEAVVSVRRAAQGANFRPDVAAIGAMIDDLYTPEEKAAFAAKLETPQAIPAEINVYDLARASGFAELTAKRLTLSALAQRDVWRNLEALQSRRLLNKALARQLEAIAPVFPDNKRDPINTAAMLAYARAGDDADELRLSQARLMTGAGLSDMHHYARLLVESHADLAARVRELNRANPTAANQLTQELLPMVAEDQAFEVVQARGTNLSSLWTHAYSALTGLFFVSPKAAGQFDSTLGPRTVAAQLSATKGDALQGAVWFYYAARYGDYLTARKGGGAADFVAAPLEASPIASNSYVELGKDEFEFGRFDSAVRAYEQALELSPDRADVHVLLAEAEHARKHSQEAINDLKTAFGMLAKKDAPDTGKTALIRMNQFKETQELRPAADAMLAAYVRRNGDYQFLQFIEGILTDAPDRKAAVDWALQLARKPGLDQAPSQIINSQLLAGAEKRAFYLVDVQNNKNDLAKATPETSPGAQQGLLDAQQAYARYLNEQGDALEAWQVLHQIEPKTARPADLLLELAAKTGHLSETLAQYDAGTLDAPSGDQVLVVASSFGKSHPDWSLQIREWEYHRELLSQTVSAAAYFGMAQVRIEQKRTDEALALVRDVTLSVGAPFENLAPAIDLLEKAGLNKNAADYAREWRTAEPWNQEAIWAVARTTQDKALLDSLRKSERAVYSLRAQAAKALRDLNSPASGTAELDLLTHATISTQEANQPFFVLARLRAKLYAEAIALKPSLGEPRLALAEAAFLNKQDALGLEAWTSYDSSGENLAWLHSAPLERAMDHEPDRTQRVEELAAQVYSQRKQYGAAGALYTRILQQTEDRAMRARVEKLKNAVDAKAELEEANKGRAPLISAELTQAATVKPRLTAGGTE